MIFLALKTEDGRITGKISFYCRMLGISRQGFYKYLANKDRPWKYQDLADAMKEIISEDECNDTYGRIRMYQALLLKQPEGVHIPSELLSQLYSPRFRRQFFEGTCCHVHHLYIAAAL